MANIITANKSYTIANNYVTDGYDQFGNYRIYATLQEKDENGNTMKLAVSDDARYGTKAATNLRAQIAKAESLQGVTIMVANARPKATTYTTFINTTSGATLRAIAEPAEDKVWVNGYYRSTTAKK